jgi:hypothetical protein
MNHQLPTARDEETLAIARDVCDLAAHTHAGMAQLARRAAAFDSAEGWTGEGIRSCAHWLSINTGFGLSTGEALVTVGHALERLPLIAAAFGAGELSFDKVRELSRVATPADEQIWVELARQASGSQLSRIARACRRAMEADAPGRDAAQRARRGLWSSWDEDGMVRIRAVLAPEDGVKLERALQSVIRDLPEDGAEPADDHHAARRADALVAVCERALVPAEERGDRPVVIPGLVVHVDAALLTGDDPDGRCHLEDGPALPESVMRRIGCDTQVVAITERDGLPIDVGRARYIVPTPLRRALQARDRFCRFPGCPVSARQAHAHHIEHWLDDGKTDLDNLVSLCGYHHRRLHDREYRIEPDAGGELRFETASGAVIRVRSQGLDEAEQDPVLLRCRLAGQQALIDASTAAAGDAGAPYDLDYAVDVITDACAFARARAGPDG